MKRISIGKALYSFVRELSLSILFYRTIKVYLCNHLNIGIWNLYKAKTIFPHPTGIVIGMKVKIGKGCKIYQNVTIGTKEAKTFKTSKYPVIGNNVIIYPNSLIIGDISIGDNVIIGAGSLILEDVPSNTVIAGNPAKIITKKITD